LSYRIEDLSIKALHSFKKPTSCAWQPAMATILAEIQRGRTDMAAVDSLPDLLLKPDATGALPAPELLVFAGEAALAHSRAHTAVSLTNAFLWYACNCVAGLPRANNRA
jgi:hypothetical protein